MSYKFPEAYYNIFNTITNVRTITHITHTTGLMEELITLPFRLWNNTTFLEFNKMKTLIEKDTSNSQQLHLLGIVKRFFKYKNRDNTPIYREYSQLLNEKYNKFNDKRVNNIKSIKEDENYITFQEIKNKFISAIPDYTDKKYIQYRDFLTTAFFVLIPPLRSMNYSEMKYIKNPTTQLKYMDKQFNYITKIDNHYLTVHNTFKTHKYIGQQEIEITDTHLVFLLDLYFRKFVKNDSLLFFYNYNSPKKIGAITLGHSITKLLSKIVGRKITLNELRHIYLLDSYKNNPSYEERKRISKSVQQTFNDTKYQLYTSFN